MSSSNLEPLQVGDTIKEGDVCKTIYGEYIPAKGSIGQKVKAHNLGYVFRRVK